MDHPAILHLYCHLMELSNDPLAASPAADALRIKFPHASHLLHMASHIDIWGGQYKVGTLGVPISKIHPRTRARNGGGCD